MTRGFKYITKDLSHLMVTRWSVPNKTKNISTRTIGMLIIISTQTIFCNKNKILQGLNILRGTARMVLEV